MPRKMTRNRSLPRNTRKKFYKVVTNLAWYLCRGHVAFCVALTRRFKWYA